MNRIYVRNTCFTLVFLITLTSAMMNQSGPSASLTNAPGEGNCTNTGCHTSSLVTSGTNHSKIFLTTGFQGNGYVPDSTYTIALSFKQSGISRYGFQITCLTSTGNLPVGTFTATNGRIQKMTAVISGNTRQYIGHTTSGTDTVKKDSTRWVFTWKAPSTNVGKIKFYACINATNSNGTNDAGDIIYAKTFEYDMSPLLPVANASSIDSVTCVNYNAQMSGNGTNSPTSYSWKFVNANISTSTLQNPIVKFTAPGTQLAILTVKNTLGTSPPDTLKVIVRATPSANILNGASGTVCKGDSLLISANTGANIAYKWSPNNKTTRTIFVKDTGLYSVTVTSTINGCAATSNNFKLNWYSKPTISLSKFSSNDTSCHQINETFTANGTLMDSIHWYVNGKIFARTKSLTLNFKSSTNSSVYAIAKSVNNCFSLASNTFNLVVTPKIYPSNFSNTKTTSTIDLKWIKTAGIDSVKYSLNAVNFNNTTTDTTLLLTGLQPSTFYNITIRSYQKGVCKFSDTTLSIRTNNCSNITYTINMNKRVCKGDSLTATILGLPKSKVSVSFDNFPFSTDTSYTFLPVSSDSLPIIIIDSNSITCPPILEKQAYLVDTFPSDPAIYTFVANSCTNSYTFSISPLYDKYVFFKNNVKVDSGTSNQFNYTGLISGDKLTAQVYIKSCTKMLGPVTFNLSAPSVATYTYSRNGSIYTFKPDDTTNADYTWFLNDTLISNSQKLVKDMLSYGKQTVNLKLKTINFPGCKDSSEESITFPDFLGIADISNYKLNVFPNPFSGQVDIQTNLTNYDLNVYDNLGRCILQLNDLSENQSINTSGWLNGLYHIVLSNDRLKLDRVLIRME